MNKKLFAAISIMAALTLTACIHDDDYGNNYVDNGKGIVVEVTDELETMATRADYTGFPVTTFETGDAIGIYVYNGEQYVSSNIKFTKQENGTWEPEETALYNPNYTYYAYYPWTETPPSIIASENIDDCFANFISSNTFCLTDQSTKENFTKSNLMAAKGLLTEARTVKFTMEHKRALAVIGKSQNKWYYTDGDGTKYNVQMIFTGNIPYEMGNRYFYLMKPNTQTSVGGVTMQTAAGKYMETGGGEITGTPTYTYSLSTTLGNSWNDFSQTKPAWLTISTNTEDGEPTEFLVTTTNSTSTTNNKGTGVVRQVPGDAVLKAATAVNDVDLSRVDNAGVSRGNSTISANCYLVHAPGSYRLPLVYGNALNTEAVNSSKSYHTDNMSTNVIQNLVNHNNDPITDPWIKNVTGTAPDGAMLVWQDIDGMITDVDIDGDYLTFNVDRGHIGEGNAVVAATIGNTVVWSWHIWVTTETLSDLTNIQTDAHTYQIAPVNIGQVNGIVKLNATTYAGDLCRIRVTANNMTMEFQVTAKDYVTGGTTYYYPSPYYQWGRKDPLYPAIGAYNAEGTFVDTYSGTTLVTSSTTTPGVTIQHPDYFYYNKANYSPYGTNSNYAGKYNYWDMDNTYHDDKNNTSRTVATVKTVYDPCPPDFCVPTSNCFYHIYSNDSSYFTWASPPPGKTWTMSGANVFFPASGYRGSSGGALFDVGSNGYYWAATPYSTNHGRLLNFYWGNSNWYNYTRASGCPVRAVAEE